MVDLDASQARKWSCFSCGIFLLSTCLIAFACFASPWLTDEYAISTNSTTIISSALYFWSYSRLKQGVSCSSFDSSGSYGENCTIQGSYIVLYGEDPFGDQICNKTPENGNSISSYEAFGLYFCKDGKYETPKQLKQIRALALTSFCLSTLAMLVNAVLTISDVGRKFPVAIAAGVLGCFAILFMLGTILMSTQWDYWECLLDGRCYVPLSGQTTGSEDNNFPVPFKFSSNATWGRAFIMMCVASFFGCVASSIVLSISKFVDPDDGDGAYGTGNTYQKIV